MERRHKILVAVFAVLVTVGTVIGVIVAVSSRTSKDEAAQPDALAVGTIAPDFTLPGLNGGTVSLAAFRGRPVIVTFGASYCGACHEEFPLLARAVREHPAVKVVGVDPEDLPGDMRQMIRDTGAT